MRKLIVSAVVAALGVAACGDSSTTTVSAVLEPLPPVSEFSSAIDNPYLPWLPGSRWVYEGREGDDVERIEVEVLSDTRPVMGVEAAVVRDTVTLDGELIEDTFDWYLQDADGNVWYVGEDSKEYEDGEVATTAGSWEAGVDGAQAGIIMYADPAAHVGTVYYQEYYEGEAVDQGEVVRVGETVTVPAGTFEDVIVVLERNPLEPGVLEEKYVAPGVGVVLEAVIEGGDERVELLEFTPGG